MIPLACPRVVRIGRVQGPRGWRSSGIWLRNDCQRDLVGTMVRQFSGVPSPVLCRERRVTAARPRPNRPSNVPTAWAIPRRTANRPRKNPPPPDCCSSFIVMDPVVSDVSSAPDEHDDGHVSMIRGRDVGLFRQRDKRQMMIPQMWHEVSSREGVTMYIGGGAVVLILIIVVVVVLMRR